MKLEYKTDEFGEEGLFSIDGKHQVMMEWEKDYMNACIDKLQPYGDVLEIGFGMGYSANRIQSYNIKSHTIIECNPVVLKRLEEYKILHPNVKIVRGRWQDVLENCEKFDCAFFDDYVVEDKNDPIRFSKFLEDMLRYHSKVNTRISVYSTTGGDSYKRIPGISIETEEFKVDIPKHCKYASGNKMYTIVITKEKDLQEKLKDLIYDPYNPNTNFELALEYKKYEQTAIALSYYLRCAEFTNNNILASEALIRASFCINRQQNRDEKELYLIKQAITASPNSIEPYYIASLYFSWRSGDEPRQRQWLDSYMYACMGINLIENNLEATPFRKDVGYKKVDIYVQKAYAGSKIGKIDEAREIYTKILSTLKISDIKRNYIIKKRSELPEPSHPISAYSNDKLFERTDDEPINGEKYMFNKQKYNNIVLDVEENLKNTNNYIKIGFDIGASKGTTINLFDDCDIIYAFEPNPVTFEYLQKIKNKHKNKYKIFTYDYAISDTNGTALFNIMYHDGYSSLLDFDESGNLFKHCNQIDNGFDKVRCRINVETKRLDTFIEENNIQNIHFIKIDTQGMDLAVIKSLGKYIKNVYKIEAEIQTQTLYKNSSKKNETIEFMKKNNFDIVEIIDNSPATAGYEERITFINNSFIDSVYQDTNDENIWKKNEYIIDNKDENEKALLLSNNILEKKTKLDGSFVFIKVSKCGTETVRLLIKESENDKNSILDCAYEDIFRYNNRQFKYSINHINYDTYFTNHLNNIMIQPIKYIGFVRNPINRLISHYNYTNRYSTKISFDEWYQKFYNINAGWSGGCNNSINSLDVTNNFMSRYLGFNSIEEINEDNIKSRYHFIVVLEDPDKYTKLANILNILNINDSNVKVANKNKSYNRDKVIISEKTKELFDENNKMDNKLYELVCKIYSPNLLDTLKNIPKTNISEKIPFSIKKIPNFIVIDNFYENPDKIREYALKLDYKNPENHGAVGYRCESGRKILDGTKELFEKLLYSRIPDGNKEGEWNYSTNGCFQWCNAAVPIVYHCDSQQYAGIVYLTPNAPPNTGTSFFRHKKYKLRNSEIFSKSDWYESDLKYKEPHLDKTQWETVDSVGNVYNRLVIFNAQQIHGVTEYFGENINNSRLFQLFFFNITD